MANQIKSPVVDATGKTRLRESLERAKRGEGPSIGQWLEFPGYSLARTVAPLGEDGLRGAGAMFAHSAFNQTSREYLLSANDNVMVCVQIESQMAVDNVQDFAAVDGIDMLFIGPNDLAASMGHVAFDHASIPDVQEAVSRVLKVGLDAGKFVGHFALSADVAAAKYNQGFHFVNCGADIVAITAWMSAEMGKLKSLTSTRMREDKREEVNDNEDDLDTKDKPETTAAYN
ncbi:hypothetical protein DHEL01_v212690 [Diaporthe helianthi]|uniref:HpcH/HpaI aldolase/citrate lyase domain-containing protein n=1 Tax=Diaporthe helianthi TaxID=158607 RepID=A0A2P5HF96_DIAHE|nr:hypothetical protein DHEL01_v212690 [Diaporthe helianthi]